MIKGDIDKQQETRDSAHALFTRLGRQPRTRRKYKNRERKKAWKTVRRALEEGATYDEALEIIKMMRLSKSMRQDFRARLTQRANDPNILAKMRDQGSDTTMPTYLIRYEKRTRKLVEPEPFKVERTPWSDWSEHELKVDFFGTLDKRRAASFVRAKLNDDAGRGQSRNLQIRITSLEQQ